MFSSNPILSKKSFYTAPAERKKTFSISSAINKSLALLVFIIVVAASTWYFELSRVAFGKNLIAYSGVLAMITGFVIRYKRSWAPWLNFIYGLFKGIFVGSISALYQTQYKGIVVQSILLCLCIFLCTLLLYKLKLIKVNQKFRSMVYASSSAIFLCYLISFILYLFDLPPIPYIHENGLIGILFSLFVLATASFHVLLDFDFFERAVNYKYPSYIEWYAAFGLVVSIIWQYLSIMRLLKKVRSR